MGNLRHIVGTKLFKQLVVITIYLVGIWVIQLMMTSVLTFFHLSLNHPLGTIEQWLFSYGPELIIFSKSLSAIICIMFLRSYLSEKHPVRECFYRHKSILKQSDFLPMIFWGIMVLMVGRPNLSTFLNLNFLTITESYIGNCFFWLTDLIIIFILNQTYSLKNFQQWFSAIYLGLLSALSFKYIYPYTAKFDYFFFYNWCAIISFSFCESCFWDSGLGKHRVIDRASIIRPFVFVILVVSPLAAIFGADVIWGKEFSYFILQTKKLWPIALSGFVVLRIYFRWWYTRSGLLAK